MTRRLSTAICLGLILWPLAASAASLTDAVRPERFTLDNGLEVWLKSRPDSGSISLLAGVKVGSRYETLRQRGLAHFVEHMVFQGTSRRSWRDLDHQLKDRGATHWAATGRDSTWFRLDVPPQELEFALRWLAEVLFDATFPADRVAVTRKVILRERGPARPRGYWWRLQRAAFGDNSLVKTPKDHKWELRNVKRRLRRDDLLRFYKEQYVPNNIVLAVVGDLDAEAARGTIKEIFGPIARGENPPQGARTALALTDDPVRVARWGSHRSSQVCCGYAVTPHSSDDCMRLRWISWLVSFRVGERVRETEGLSYGAWWDSSEYQGGSLFSVCADCSYSDIPRVERIIREELARVRSTPISQREVGMICTNAATRGQKLIQDNPGLASLFVHRGLRNEPPPDMDRMIESMTPASLQKVVQTYLKPQRSFVAYARPRKTPLEHGVALAIAAAVSLGLILLGHRRNARIAPPPEHAEHTVSYRITPRFVGMNLLALLIWLPLFLFVLVGLPWRLSDLLFHRAMFTLDFVLFASWCALVLVAWVALGLTLCVRRAVASRDGVLLQTLGFHLLLRPDKIASVRCEPVRPLRDGIDPRSLACGGDPGRWAIVRMKCGSTVCLALPDPDQFVRDAARYLGDAVPVTPPPLGVAGDEPEPAERPPEPTPGEGRGGEVKRP